jgi:hypothetical protein
MPANDQVTRQIAVFDLPGNVSITGTGLTGTIQDTKDFESLTYVIQTGAVSAGAFTIEIKESDDSGMSGATVVPIGEIISADGSTGLTGGAALGITMTDSTGAFQIGDVGKMRYHRLRVVGNATAVGAVSVVAIKGHPRSMPTS